MKGHTRKWRFQRAEKEGGGGRRRGARSEEGKAGLTRREREEEDMRRREHMWSGREGIKGRRLVTNKMESRESWQLLESEMSFSSEEEKKQPDGPGKRDSLFRSLDYRRNQSRHPSVPKPGQESSSTISRRWERDIAIDRLSDIPSICYDFCACCWLVNCLLWESGWWFESTLAI